MEAPSTEPCDRQRSERDSAACQDVIDHRWIIARNLLSRPLHRGRSEWGSASGGEGLVEARAKKYGYCVSPLGDGGPDHRDRGQAASAARLLSLYAVGMSAAVIDDLRIEDGRNGKRAKTAVLILEGQTLQNMTVPALMVIRSYSVFA